MSLLLAQSTLPPAGSIREKAAEVVSRPYYELDASRPGGTPLIVEFFRWLSAPFKSLFDMLEGVPDPLRWLIVILCVLACIGLVAHIIYSLATTMSGPLARRRPSYDDAAQEVDPQEFETQAEPGRVGPGPDGATSPGPWPPTAWPSPRRIPATSVSEAWRRPQESVCSAEGTD